MCVVCVCEGGEVEVKERRYRRGGKHSIVLEL